jgi:hypothetical protein
LRFIRFERAPVLRELEVALEDDAVNSREHGDDLSGKLGDEVRQRLRVLLRAGAPNQPVPGGRTLFLLVLLGCGSAAFGGVE